MLGELDDQDGVLRRQAHRRQETDLEEYVVLEPAKPYGERCANQAYRNNEQHGERHRPAFVQCRKAEEYNEQRKRVKIRRLIAR